MTEFTSEFIVKQRERLIKRDNFFAWDNEISLDALDHIEHLQKRVDELEVQLKSKDIIINNQQGRLNYYATKDLLGEKKKMSSDENIEKMKRNLSPEQLDKASVIYDEIINAVEYHNKFRTMSNVELAKALMLNVWAELPMWSAFSELIEVVIERLMGNEKL